MPINKKIMNANNSLGSGKLFRKRIIYKNLAFTDSPLSTVPEDLYPIRNFMRYENYLYGRINGSFTPVIPRKNRILPLETDSSQYALDFVVSAFKKMKEKIKREIVAGNIPTDAFFASIEVANSFEDANVAYNQWLNRVRDTFVQYVDQKSLAEKIVDYESFLGIFKKHLVKASEDASAITFSSYVVDKKNTIRSTGLVIEIANHDFSSDKDKIDFISQDNFQYYVNLAEQYGFFVDYNAPWRLVANIVSKPMKHNIMEINGGYSNLASFFDQYYRTVASEDINILMNLSFATYTDYIGRFPNFKKVDLVNGRLRKRVIKRAPTTAQKIKDGYNYIFWLDYYVDLKNAEKSLKYLREDLNLIKNESFLIQKLDKVHARNYINNKFQDIPSIEGSFYSELTRTQFLVDEMTKEDYANFIKETVREYRKKVS